MEIWPVITEFISQLLFPSTSTAWRRRITFAMFVEDLQFLEAFASIYTQFFTCMRLDRLAVHVIYIQRLTRFHHPRFQKDPRRLTWHSLSAKKKNQPNACKHALCWPRQSFRTLTCQFGKELVRFEDITSPSLTFSEEANPRWKVRSQWTSEAHRTLKEIDANRFYCRYL